MSGERNVDLPIDSPMEHRQFKEWRVGAGFTDGFRGTYWNAREDSYLYIKPAHYVETRTQAGESLAFLRYVTEKGILYPGTVWDAFRDEKGGFQLFAVTPALIGYSAEEQEKPGRQRLKKFGVGYRGLLNRDSHILSWYKRLDPDFQPQVPPPDDSVLYLLNPIEASHPDNWAWDQEGTLYPVDVEVVSVSGRRAAGIVHSWYAASDVSDRP